MMNLATALNRKYIPYTVVMITSLCKNNKTQPIRFFLLHHELQETDLEQIRSALSSYEIEIVPLKVEAALFEDRLPRTEVWSIETYYRLLLLDILPDDVERLLYLDVDIIINQSIEEFYHRDFGGNDMVVCENAGGFINAQERLAEKQKEMFAPMFEKGFRYFNAGVLLMNIAEMKKQYSFQTYQKAIQEWDYNMGAPDQDILNYVHWQKIAYEDSKKYNYFSRVAHEEGLRYESGKKELCIIHFTDQKPWETKNYHYPIEQIWWDYAKETPFYSELLESFLAKTLFDDCVEKWMKSLVENTQELKSELAESLELNQRLIDMISK